MGDINKNFKHEKLEKGTKVEFLVLKEPAPTEELDAISVELFNSRPMFKLSRVCPKTRVINSKVPSLFLWELYAFQQFFHSAFHKLGDCPLFSQRAPGYSWFRYHSIPPLHFVTLRNACGATTIPVAFLIFFFY